MKTGSSRRLEYVSLLVVFCVCAVFGSQRNLDMCALLEAYIIAVLIN